MWPQLLFLALMAMSLGQDLVRHNKVRATKDNVWLSLFAQALVVLILWAGGFWKPLGF